ncbi:hypothetical protein LX87_05712, partial [Larkinella arboricola]
SKILGPRYSELITKDNIDFCLETVRSMGIVDFNVDDMIQKSTSNHIHVTEDIKFDMTKEDRRAVSRLVKHPLKWDQQERRNSFGLRSNRAGRQRQKEQFKMYGKGVEMNSKKVNREFMAAHGIPENSFDGITRLEHKLQGRGTILKRLNLMDNQLTSILNVKASPMVDILTSVFDLSTDERQRKGFSMSDIEKLTVLEKFEFNWAEIEREVRQYAPKKVTRWMEGYRKIAQKYEMNRTGHHRTGTDILNEMIELIKQRWN